MLWGGLWQSTDEEAFAKDGAALYADEGLWETCQQRGYELLTGLYSRKRNLAAVRDATEGAWRSLAERRRQDIMAGILWSQQLRATEYFSRWIELKESIVYD